MARRKGGGGPQKGSGRAGRSGRGRGLSGDARAAAKRKEREVRDARDRKKILARLSVVEPDGLVVCMYGSHADVAFADGSVRFCLLTPKVHKLFGVCVGDRVWTEKGSGDDERIIVGRAERSTSLRRRRSEEDRTGHVIAANIDQLAITAALYEPPLRTGALDRYLLLASVLDIEPLLVLTKVDLAPMDDPGWDVLAPYRELGLRIVGTSAVSGRGMDELRDALRGRLTAFAGHSGVGKSALCQALGLTDAPETGDLSRSGGRIRGRHTTSIARLLELPSGGWVVDTPGVRSIGLVDIDRGDVRVHFPELAEAGADCEYSDCLHLDEDGCAVRKAVKKGELSKARYAGYARLMESIED